MHDIREWNIPGIDAQVRLAPVLTCRNEHVGSFAIFRLHAALEDFGVGQFEGAAVIDWFWRTAGTWPKQATQEAFDKYARARVSDRVGYTRRYSEACSVIDRLYDKARAAGVDFTEVTDAVAFLAKPQDIPESCVFTNNATTLIDMTKRSDFPKLLKIDTAFLPVLAKLWPVDVTRVGHRDVVTKRIPVGSAVRDFPVYKLVFWHQHPTVGIVELEEAVESHNGDPLDLRGENLCSKWAEQAKADAEAVPDEMPEARDSWGTRMLRENNGGKSRKRRKLAPATA